MHFWCLPKENRVVNWCVLSEVDRFNTVRVLTRIPVSNKGFFVKSCNRIVNQLWMGNILIDG